MVPRPRKSGISFLPGAVLLVWIGLVSAQQPAKSPPLPPINPPNARLEQIISGLNGPGLAVAYSEAADTLVAACEEGTLQSWGKDVLLNIRAGAGTSHRLAGHDGSVLAIAWNGGPVLASLGLDRKIHLWAWSEAKRQQTILSDTFVRALAMSPDGKLLASAGNDPAIQLWDVADAKPKAQLKDHSDWVLALAFSPDGKWLASADCAGAVRLWNVADGKKLMNLPAPPVPAPKEPPEPSPVEALAFSPDSKQLAVGSANGQIALINLADGKTIRTFPGHTSAVTCLVFHPSGNLLVSSSKDRTVRLWNPANGQPFKVLEGHTAWVQGVVLMLQGTRLASVSADQTVRLWNLTDAPKN
jgi:WD40 repeat protein